MELDQQILIVTQVEYVHVILDTLAINVLHVLQDIIAVVVHAQVIVFPYSFLCIFSSLTICFDVIVFQLFFSRL